MPTLAPQSSSAAAFPFVRPAERRKMSRATPQLATRRGVRHQFVQKCCALQPTQFLHSEKLQKLVWTLLAEGAFTPDQCRHLVISLVVPTIQRMLAHDATAQQARRAAPLPPGTERGPDDANYATDEQAAKSKSQGRWKLLAIVDKFVAQRTQHLDCARDCLLLPDVALVFDHLVESSATPDAATGGMADDGEVIVLDADGDVSGAAAHGTAVGGAGRPKSRPPFSVPGFAATCGRLDVRTIGAFFEWILSRRVKPDTPGGSQADNSLNFQQPSRGLVLLDLHDRSNDAPLAAFRALDAARLVAVWQALAVSPSRRRFPQSVSIDSSLLAAPRTSTFCRAFLAVLPLLPSWITVFEHVVLKCDGTCTNALRSADTGSTDGKTRQALGCDLPAKRGRSPAAMPASCWLCDATRWRTGIGNPILFAVLDPLNETRLLTLQACVEQPHFLRHVVMSARAVDNASRTVMQGSPPTTLHQLAAAVAALQLRQWLLAWSSSAAAGAGAATDDPNMFIELAQPLAAVAGLQQSSRQSSPMPTAPAADDVLALFRVRRELSV